MRGCYRIVSLDDEARARPYVVIDAAGAWVHEDAALPAARAWVDRQALDDTETPPPRRRLARAR
jgi:hypothetical protein